MRNVNYFAISAAALLIVAAAALLSGAKAEENPPLYTNPEVAGEIIRVRDLLLNGRYDKVIIECDKAQRKYPDLLVWRFAAMLAPQARMLELHDWSLEEDYFEGWNDIITLAKKIKRKRPLVAYDHLCLGGGLGVLGLHYARAKRFRKTFALGLTAMRELSRAKKADPDNNDVYLGYGIYHYYRGVLSQRLKWLPFFADDKRRGLEELDRARKGLFGSSLADLAELYLYKDEGKYAEGLKFTRKLRHRYPDGLLLPQLEGHFLIYLKQYEAALKEFDPLVEADPYNGPLHIYRGAALYYTGHIDEAGEELWTGIHLKSIPEYKAWAYYFLGEIALKKGDKSLAKKYWMEAVDTYPGNIDAKKALEKLKDDQEAG